MGNKKFKLQIESKDKNCLGLVNGEPIYIEEYYDTIGGDLEYGFED